MKKKLTLLLMGFIFLITSQFCSLSEQWITIRQISYVSMEKDYLWKLTTNQFVQTPKWQPGIDVLPLSYEKAIDIATNYLRKKKLENLSLETIELNRILGIERNDLGNYSKWFYHVKFAKSVPSKRRFNYGDDNPELLVIILLDGSVVEPTVTEMETF